MLFQTLKKQHGNTDDVSATDPKLVVVTGSEPNDDTHTASETYPIASELPSTSFLPSSLKQKMTASSLPPMVEDYIDTNHIVEATTATGKRISETKMMPTVMHSTFWNDGFGRWAIVYYVSKSVAVTVLSIMFQNL